MKTDEWDWHVLRTRAVATARSRYPGRDPGWYDDRASEAVVDLVRASRSETVDTPEALIRTIVLRRCYDACRAWNNQGRDLDALARELEAPGSPEDPLRARQLLTLVDTLPKRLGDALHAQIDAGGNTKEAAHERGLRLGTHRDHLTRARKALAAALATCGALWLHLRSAIQGVTRRSLGTSVAFGLAGGLAVYAVVTSIWPPESDAVDVAVGEYGFPGSESVSTASVRDLQPLAIQPEEGRRVRPRPPVHRVERSAPGAAESQAVSVPEAPPPTSEREDGFLDTAPSQQEVLVEAQRLLDAGSPEDALQVAAPLVDAQDPAVRTAALLVVVNAAHRTQNWTLVRTASPLVLASSQLGPAAERGVVVWYAQALFESGDCGELKLLLSDVTTRDRAELRELYRRCRRE